jgi:hypothetical protein
VAVTACLLIGLPLAAWLFSRRLEASRPHVAGGFGPPAGAADRWLIERYELSALRRYAVRQAVTSGRALDDPVERAAACDLAAAVLNGQIKVGTGIRLGLRVQLAEATVLIGAGAFIMAWGRSPAGIAPGLLGGWYAIRGYAGCAWCMAVLNAPSGVTRSPPQPTEPASRAHTRSQIQNPPICADHRRRYHSQAVAPNGASACDYQSGFALLALPKWFNARVADLYIYASRYRGDCPLLPRRCAPAVQPGRVPAAGGCRRTCHAPCGLILRGPLARPARIRQWPH